MTMISLFNHETEKQKMKMKLSREANKSVECNFRHTYISYLKAPRLISNQFLGFEKLVNLKLISS